MKKYSRKVANPVDGTDNVKISTKFHTDAVRNASDWSMVTMRKNHIEYGVNSIPIQKQ